jgi:hypothetical protein
VTAPFAADLCGYRPNGLPGTSDANDQLSIELGSALFDELGVDQTRPAQPQIGAAMEQSIRAHLESIRPDLLIEQSRTARLFEQYRHLDVFRTFESSYGGPTEELEGIAAELLEGDYGRDGEYLAERILAVNERGVRDHALVLQLLDFMPHESMLKIDVTVASPEPARRLLVGLSSKWTFRTDRAQDPVSQGSRLVSLRRGPMPHFAVVTMEPRPAMLRLVAYGSGAVDCVYHLALPELRRAAQRIEDRRGRTWGPRVYLERMIAQGRVRPFGDLVDEVRRLPTW